MAMSGIFTSLPTTIFEHMSGLARSNESINLGQGFPDFGWPQSLLDRAAEELRTGSNQYPPARGLPELREAVADHYRRHHRLEVEPEQVTITSGATEAIADTVLALVQPGDEVLLFEPLYDAYLPMVLRAGGVPRFVPLEPPHWRLEKEALESAFSDRTRFVIFNNPHNPASRIFTRDELALLAALCVRHDVTVLSDEVWEHMVFDGRSHLPIAALPGMAERTVKIGSAGKIFSLTGWKVGWIVAPLALAPTLARAHQYISFSTPPNLQAAVAFGLEEEMDSVASSVAAFGRARDRLRRGLEEAGFVTLLAEGTYFLSIDLARSGIEVDDVTFCERAVREARVAAIPLSALHSERPAHNVVRTCFAKKDATLDEGIARLSEARSLFA